VLEWEKHWNELPTSSVDAKRDRSNGKPECVVQVHRLMIIALLGVLMLGCAPTYIENTKVPNTPENREIVTFVERYRTAIEHRDNDLLLSLVSPRYLENASTTDISDDDYGLRELVAKHIPEFTQKVQGVDHKLKVLKIQRRSNVAFVDYEYDLTFRYKDGAETRLHTKRDVNRLELLRENGQWRIRSGL